MIFPIINLNNSTLLPHLHSIIYTLIVDLQIVIWFVCRISGQGDMAVSNTLGSNVFDVLIGLALPWFIKTAMVSPGDTVSS